jgi:hypothetical protein
MNNRRFYGPVYLKTINVPKPMNSSEFKLITNPKSGGSYYYVSEIDEMNNPIFKMGKLEIINKQVGLQEWEDVKYMDGHSYWGSGEYYNKIYVKTKNVPQPMNSSKFKEVANPHPKWGTTYYYVSELDEMNNPVFKVGTLEIKNEQVDRFEWEDVKYMDGKRTWGWFGRGSEIYYNKIYKLISGGRSRKRRSGNRRKTLVNK